MFHLFESTFEKCWKVFLDESVISILTLSMCILQWTLFVVHLFRIIYCGRNALFVLLFCKDDLLFCIFFKRVIHCVLILIIYILLYTCVVLFFVCLFVFGLSGFFVCIFFLVCFLAKMGIINPFRAHISVLVFFKF